MNAFHQLSSPGRVCQGLIQELDLVFERCACYGLGQAWFLLTESIHGHRSCRWHLRAGADGLGLELKLGRSTVGASHALSEPSFALVRLSEFMAKALA